MMKTLLLGLSDTLARALSACLRPARSLIPVLCRLWRLALLRSAVEGRVPVTTQFDGPIRIAGRPKITLGQHCRLGREVFFESGGQGRIVLDNNVRLNAGVVVVAHAEVKIESDVLVGEYVSIRDADHAIQPDQLIRFQDHVANPVSIGRGAWIGRGAAILKGVHIGAGAVIGANSVVTSDIPENAIAVGVPARVLRYRDGSLPSP